MHTESSGFEPINERIIPKYRQGIVSCLFTLRDVYLRRKDKILDDQKKTLELLEFTPAKYISQVVQLNEPRIRLICRHLLSRLTSMEGLNINNNEIRLAISSQKKSSEEVIGLVIQRQDGEFFFLGLKQWLKIKKRVLSGPRIGLLETVLISQDCQLEELKGEEFQLLDTLLASTQTRLNPGFSLKKLPWKQAWENFWRVEWLNIVELLLAIMIGSTALQMISENLTNRIASRTNPIWFFTTNLAESFLLFLASVLLLHVIFQRYIQDYTLDVHTLTPAHTKSEYAWARRHLDKEFKSFLKIGWLRKTCFWLDGLLSYVPPTTFFYALLAKPDVFALRAIIVQDFASFSDLLTVALIGQLEGPKQNNTNEMKNSLKKNSSVKFYEKGQELDKHKLRQFEDIESRTWHKVEVDLRGSAKGASAYQISWAVDYLARSRIWSEFFLEPELLKHHPQNQGDNIILPNLNQESSRALQSIYCLYDWLLDDFLAVQGYLSQETSLPAGKSNNGQTRLRENLDFRLKIMYAGNEQNKQPNPLKQSSMEGSTPAIATAHLNSKIGHDATGRTVIIDDITTLKLISHSGQLFGRITGGKILDFLQNSLEYRELSKDWSWRAYYVPLSTDYQRLRTDNDNEEGRIHYLLHTKV